MGGRSKKWFAVAALVVGALVAPAAAAANASGPAFNPSTPQPLVIDGHLVTAPFGDPWTPHGVNKPGLEYACVQGWDPSFTVAEAEAMVSWGIDVVRLPLNQDCWLGVDGAPVPGFADWSLLIWGRADAYRGMVSSWVHTALDAGLAVIVDLHWSAPAGVMADGQRPMADEQTLEFWREVGLTAYNTWGFWGSVMFEVFNEPYSPAAHFANAAGYELTWDCWLNGGCELPVEEQGAAVLSGDTYVNVGMQEIIQAIRSTGANNPIIVDGLAYANDLTGWLANAPAEVGPQASEPQIIAGWHNYNGQGCAETCWNSTIRGVANEVPVIMTEFGYDSGDPGYLERVMDWGDANGVGYFPWAWWQLTDDEVSSDPSLADYRLLNPDLTPRPPVGTAFRWHLDALENTPQENFAVQAYRDFLGRDPTPGELAAVAGMSRGQLVTALSTSPEWITTVITRFYQDTLGRNPDAGGLAYWVGEAQRGRPIVEIAAAFYASDEYFSGIGGGTYASWVSDLYQKLMDRPADAEGRDHWVRQLQGGASRQLVATFFYQSPEKLRYRVTALYQQLLGRGTDPEGLAYWAEVIKAQGDIKLAALLAESDEYLAKAQTPH